MKTISQLLEIAQAQKLPLDRSYWANSTVVSDCGNLYPICNGQLLNPLSARNLLFTMPVTNPNMRKLVRTISVADEFARTGYDIVARTESAAPRVIKLHDKHNTVVILGDVAKREQMLLPILTSQLADEQWAFAEIPAWKQLGFTRPSKLIYRDLTNSEPKYNEAYISHGSLGQSESWQGYFEYDNVARMAAFYTSDSYDLEVAYSWCNAPAAKHTEIVIESRPKCIYDDNAPDF